LAEARQRHWLSVLLAFLQAGWQQYFWQERLRGSGSYSCLQLRHLRRRLGVMQAKIGRPAPRQRWAAIEEDPSQEEELEGNPGWKKTMC
jgi:hypothetical protein